MIAIQELKKLQILRQSQKHALLEAWRNVFNALSISLMSCVYVKDINITFYDNKYEDSIAYEFSFTDVSDQKIFEPDIQNLEPSEYAVILDIMHILHFNVGSFMKDFPDLRNGDHIKISTDTCKIDLDLYQDWSDANLNL